MEYSFKQFFADIYHMPATFVFYDTAVFVQMHTLSTISPH